MSKRETEKRRGGRGLEEGGRNVEERKKTEWLN